MQPNKTSTQVVMYIVLLLLGAYSIAESWWFGLALAAIATTVVLQRQVTQLQQRIEQLEQQHQQAEQFNPKQQLYPKQQPLVFPADAVSSADQLHATTVQQHAQQSTSTQQSTTTQPSIAASNLDVSTAAPVSQSSANTLPAWMQQNHAVSSSAPSTHNSSMHTSMAHPIDNTFSNNTFSQANTDAAHQQPSSLDSTTTDSPDWWQKAQQWMLQGNPILRVAVLLLLVGVVLLLRFATENWQLSLATKLVMIAVSGAVATGLAYRFRAFNALVAVAVQGVGLAVVFLTLIFAHQNQVLSDLLLSGVLMALLLTTLLTITTLLSLRQSSLYLAILALGMAYLAPLLIPQSQPDALLIFAYYLLINLAVAVLNHVKGWKILNHIAFVASMLLAGAIIVDTEPKTQYLWLDVLLWLHIALFTYVSIRYSQLMLQQQQLRKLDNAALLDVGLIFAVPIVGFSLHAFLMQDDVWGLTLGAVALASIYAALVCWIRRRHSELALLSTSFMVLTMVFVALIFPLAQGAHWSSVGWVVQGSALVVWGCTQRSRLSRYMGVALLLLSSIAMLIQLWSDLSWSVLSTAIYSLAMFIAAGALLKYDSSQQRYFSSSVFSALFLSLALYAGAWIIIEVLHLQHTGLNGYVAAATFLLGIFSVWMHYRAGLNWQQSHVALIMLFSVLHWGAWLNADVFSQGVWSTSALQYAFLTAGLLLAALLLFALRMLQLGVAIQQLWSALTLLALASIGIALLPNWGVIAMAMAPVIYAALHGRSWQHNKLLQQPTVWVMALLWLFLNNLYLYNINSLYLLPILNPNDALNLLVLAGLLRLIFAAPDSNNRDELLLLKIASLLMALHVLSFVLIRALHVYADIPLQANALWQSGVVQVSLTVMWMLLALVLTSYASRKHSREFWFVGAALLVLVVTKLVLLDLAQTETLTRVISFMAAGGLMLVIAYVAPLPPENEQQTPP